MWGYISQRDFVGGGIAARGGLEETASQGNNINTTINNKHKEMARDRIFIMVVMKNTNSGQTLTNFPVLFPLL